MVITACIGARSIATRFLCICTSLPGVCVCALCVPLCVLQVLGLLVGPCQAAQALLACHSLRLHAQQQALLSKHSACKWPYKSEALCFLAVYADQRCLPGLAQIIKFTAADYLQDM